MNLLILLCALLALPFSIHAGQKYDVTIVNRQDNEARYTYTLPASSNTTSNVDVNCSGSADNVGCSGSGKSTTVSTPAQVRSYNLAGATLTLELPDGRRAVINCDSKLNWTDFSKMDQVRRSCKVPMVTRIQAEFSGEKAKLKWPVGIDGKKFQSETYRILAVIDKP